MYSLLIESSQVFAVLNKKWQQMDSIILLSVSLFYTSNDDVLLHTSLHEDDHLRPGMGLEDLLI